MRIWMRRTGWALVLGLGVAGLLWFAWPRPIAVDLAVVSRGPMEVTVDDEGKTRVRHIYTVSAPIAGKVLRTSREVGDQVTRMRRSSPSCSRRRRAFHDVRSREELQAAAAAAEAAVRLAEAEVRRIEAALAFSRSELQRAEVLARTDAISPKALDKAKLDVETNEAALQARRRSSRCGAASAPASRPGSSIRPASPATESCVLHPARGSGHRPGPEDHPGERGGRAGRRAAGRDRRPVDLEVVADLLSTDAVRIKPVRP